ncbi:MAG: ABC transporter ATP-binding protein [Ancalomicrobiaceae bacterium]|nr:ABC transporter ATP-binding protein [Ancalomicrobiaceae bacterium]
MADVELTHLTKRFGTTTAVDDLSLAIADGEFIVLLGPTGAGKTTLLRLVAGLERAEAGAIAIGGRDMTREPPVVRDVAFVFQQYSLYPHLSVYDNLAFPLRSPVRGMSEAAIRQRVEETAHLVRIHDKLANRATRLSGGQMQRVAIGRALVRRPAIYLMDEPLSSLDAKLRSDLRLELKRIQAELGATILYVTHDQTEAMTLASRIGVMDHGRLVQIGSPREIYRDPVNSYVATRLGTPSINLLPADLLPADQLAVGTRTVGARSEHILISRVSGGLARGRVVRKEHLGGHVNLHVLIGGAEVVKRVDADTDFLVDDPVDVALHVPLCFDHHGDRLDAGGADANT